MEMKPELSRSPSRSVEKNAYGYLKSEKECTDWYAFRRLTRQENVRLPFVSCDVMPDIEDNIDIEIADDDIRIDTYRSSGAGGQHINKTSSAIRIHIYRQES